MNKIYDYKKITHVEAKKMMENKKDIIILDVRTKEEFEESYIDKAVLIPNEEIYNKASQILKDKDRNILVYCQSGKRSQEACKKLVKLGYKNIYDFGGIINWPFEVIR